MRNQNPEQSQQPQTPDTRAPGHQDGAGGQSGAPRQQPRTPGEDNEEE